MNQTSTNLYYRIITVNNKIDLLKLECQKMLEKDDNDDREDEDEDGGDDGDAEGVESRCFLRTQSSARYRTKSDTCITLFGLHNIL